MSQARSFRSRDIVLQEIRRGDLCAIMVEGEETGSDASLLKFILREVTTEVAFFGRGGRQQVLTDFQEMIPQLPTDRLYGILDRDFESDSEVERCCQGAYLGNTFFWRRYTIENYLLEPTWIVEVAQQLLWRDPGLLPPGFQNESDAEAMLLEVAKQLAPIAAGNMAIAHLTAEQKQRGMLAEARSYFEGGADTVLARLIAHYSPWAAATPDLFASANLKERYSANLLTIHSALQSLEGTHKLISGKYLLRALHQRLLGIPGHRIRYSDLQDRLIVLASQTLPADMKMLVEDRILPRWRRARAASRP